VIKNDHSRAGPCVNLPPATTQISRFVNAVIKNRRKHWRYATGIVGVEVLSSLSYGTSAGSWFLYKTTCTSCPNTNTSMAASSSGYSRMLLFKYTNKSQNLYHINTFNFV